MKIESRLFAAAVGLVSLSAGVSHALDPLSAEYVLGQNAVSNKVPVVRVQLTAPVDPAFDRNATAQKVLEFVRKKDESEEGKKIFIALMQKLRAEILQDTEAEAKAAVPPMSIDKYRDSGNDALWTAFDKRIAALSEKMGAMSDGELFAEFLKTADRFKLQQGRFVADNQFEVEERMRAFFEAAIKQLKIEHVMKPS